MKIATWNINSIRLRKENVINFLKKENIDILCLQETKTVDEQFPITFLRTMDMLMPILEEKSHIMVWQYYQRFLLKIHPFKTFVT